MCGTSPCTHIQNDPYHAPQNSVRLNAETIPKAAAMEMQRLWSYFICTLTGGPTTMSRNSYVTRGTSTSPVTAASSVNRLGTVRGEKAAEVGMTEQRDHKRVFGFSDQIVVMRDSFDQSTLSLMIIGSLDLYGRMDAGQ